jgi:flagellar hook-associated protein 2
VTTTSLSASTTATTTDAYTLSSLTGSSTQQITGLSSGLNTDQIVEELMQAKEQPLDNLEAQQSQLNARNTELVSLQAELQTVQTDAQSLLDPTVYDPTQTVTSSDSSSVGASLASGTGAVEGGYEVAVTKLAQSAQRTFTYTSPSTADTVTIDGQPVTIAANESAASFAQAVNANSNLDVYATATQAGNIVLSNRATGDETGTNYIQVTDSGGALSEIGGDAKPGQDAEYTVDGGITQTSASNSVADGIPGVTLTLSSVTGSTPVTVNVSEPSVSSSTVSTALQQFITDYNKTVTDIQTQLSTVPADTSGTETGTLYGDEDLKTLLSQMRSAMYATVSGVSGGKLNSMLDIGVSTGSAVGNGTLSSASIDGDLTLNSTTLSSALATNPTAVQQLIGGWASSFSSLVGVDSDAGGTISQRISGNTNEVSDLGNQISSMQAALTDQQNQLVKQFAAMESALSSNSSESSWLTEQVNSLS